MSVWTVELGDCEPMLPTAEHLLQVGLKRATEALSHGWPVEDVARILVVAGYAADLVQVDAAALEGIAP